METPIYFWAFWAPVHDNVVVQVMLVSIMILILADLGFGMFAAGLQKNFKSTKIREGLAHKCSELMFILIADVVDALVFAGANMTFELPEGSALVVVCGSLIIMEIASLAEIATKINPKLVDSPVFRVLDNAHIINASKEAE